MKTKSKIIVVWGRGDLLSLSFEFFLSAKEEWEVINISKKEDLDALILEAETTRQEIIFIYQCSDKCPADFPLQFAQDHPVVKVISVSLDNNAMEVYSKQKIIVKQVSDLITVIENELHLNYQDRKGESK